MPAVVAMMLGATCLTARAQGPGDVDAGSGKTSPPAAVAAHALSSVTAAELNLFVSHRMNEGRLVVKVGAQAVLSAPFSTIKPGANGWSERPLSVSSGRQTVTVLVIDGAGRLVAQQATEVNLATTGMASLAVAEHEGTGKGLTLEWRTP